MLDYSIKSLLPWKYRSLSGFDSRRKGTSRGGVSNYCSVITGLHFHFIHVAKESHIKPDFWSNSTLFYKMHITYSTHITYKRNLNDDACLTILCLFYMYWSSVKLYIYEWIKTKYIKFQQNKSINLLQYNIKYRLVTVK